MKISYYELKKYVESEPNEGEFIWQTAALMFCMTCGKNISGMGGPGHCICIECGDLINSGKAELQIDGKESREELIAIIKELIERVDALYLQINPNWDGTVKEGSIIDRAKKVK